MTNEDKALKIFKDTCVECVIDFKDAMDSDEDTDSLAEIILMIKNAEDFDDVEAIMANELCFDEPDMISDLYRWALRAAVK